MLGCSREPDRLSPGTERSIGTDPGQRPPPVTHTGREKGVVSEWGEPASASCRVDRGGLGETVMGAGGGGGPEGPFLQGDSWSEDWGHTRRTEDQREAGREVGGRQGAGRAESRL